MSGMSIICPFLNIDLMHLKCGSYESMLLQPQKILACKIKQRTHLVQKGDMRVNIIVAADLRERMIQRK